VELLSNSHRYSILIVSVNVGKGQSETVARRLGAAARIIVIYLFFSSRRLIIP